MVTVLNYRHILDAPEHNLDHLRNKGHIATMWDFNIWCPDITRDRERSSNSHSTRMENFIRTCELTVLTIPDGTLGRHHPDLQWINMTVKTVNIYMHGYSHPNDP
jgi:hypothetical protein